MTGELKLRIKLECRLNVGARASKIYSFGSSPLATRLSTILQDYSPPMENHFVACLPKGSPLFANICILNNRSDTNPVYAYICVYIYILRAEYTRILQWPDYAVKGNENARFNAPC